MFLLPSSTMYLQVDIICFEALSACSAILFFAECFKTQKAIFRISLIVIAIISALIALLYRYGLGVRVLRSRYQRSKLRDDFNYNIYHKILRRYVSCKSGKINYNELIKKKGRELMQEFIAMLAVFGPESTPSLFNNKNDKIAYWINAYNALVIFAMTEYFPISTILDIRTGFCCCTASDYYLYYKINKRKRKRKRKRKINKNNNNNNNNYKNNNNKKYKNNKNNLFGGINIKYDRKKHQLLIEDKNNDQLICILNEKKRQQIAERKRRRIENGKKLKKSYWFFEALRFEVDGSLYSLREIERDIICNKFGDDARILCCLNKGCIGSPKLLNKPFEGNTLNEQLNTMNRLLCSGVIKSKDLCIKSNIIAINSIFKHFKTNYIKYAKKNQWIISNRHNSIDNDNGALLGYIYHFANKEMRNKLSYPIISGYCIKYIEFDWRLSIHKSSKHNKQQSKKNNNNDQNKQLKLQSI